MWKQILDLGKQYIGLANKVEHNSADIQKTRDDVKALGVEIKELREELRALADLVQQYRWEQRYDRDMAAKDRENLLLRLELYLERGGRSLPPGDGS